MTAIPAASSFSSPGRRGWIQSPGWDLVWMFSALWAGAILLLGSIAPPVLGLLAVLFLFERLLSVVHAWSTTYMVLFSPLLRPARRENRPKFVIVPAAIAIASLALGLLVSATQRYPSDGSVTWGIGLFGLYISVFWVGHFWHFGNQDFGVLTIYRAKAGQDRWIDRRVDKLYTAAMMFVIQPIVYLSLVTTTAFSEIVHHVVPISREAAHSAADVAVAAAVLMSLGVAIWEMARPNRSLPKLLYVFVIFLHPTVLYASVRAGEMTLAHLYLIAYLWSHWFIAVGLVERINSRFYRSRGDSTAIALVRHFSLLGAIAGLVFVATERHKEYLLFNTDGFRYKELLAAITPEQTLVIGLVLGFFLGEQLLHYYCDRCLFRFRDPAVRERVAPFLLG